eukprot:TRINITY_DN2119_c0_g1_i1.p1 TRINITY_DN2119_c0_g1~~TRINITY_DN2119_c0_g1_i1.p1  ORF type:complete len:612 (+),score=150.88 TRINITY_DN2119_c0_g1_i1:66-1901(+)
MSRTLEADDLMDELMHGEGILGTFFSILWHKGAGRRMHQLWDIHIPDTIIYLYSKPLHWFFTSRSGEIKKKSRGRLNSKYIEEHFKVNGTSVSDIKAMYLEALPRTQHDDARTDARVKISYCYSRDLRKFLQEDKPNGILQLFFDPKPEIGGGGPGSGGAAGGQAAAGAAGEGAKRSKGGQARAGFCGTHVGAIRNSIVQTTWSPGCFFIEKRVNKHRLDNQKIDINVRAATFDDYQNTETVPLVSDAVAASFQRMCQMIADHISVVFRYKLASLVLNFKIDRNDTIWLLWCSSLRIVSEEKPAKALTATTAPPLQQYNREQTEQRQKTQQARAAWSRRRRQLDAALQESQQWLTCPLSQREYPASELCSVTMHTLMSALSGIDPTPQDQAQCNAVPTPMLLLHPDMTAEEYKTLSADPGFAYRTVKISRPSLDTLIKCASGIKVTAKTRMPTVIRDLRSGMSSVRSRSVPPPARSLGPSPEASPAQSALLEGSCASRSLGGRATAPPQHSLPPLSAPAGDQAALEFYTYNRRGIATKQGYAHPTEQTALDTGYRAALFGPKLERRLQREKEEAVKLLTDAQIDPPRVLGSRQRQRGAPAVEAITPAPTPR